MFDNCDAKFKQRAYSVFTYRISTRSSNCSVFIMVKQPDITPQLAIAMLIFLYIAFKNSKLPSVSLHRLPSFTPCFVTPS